MTDDIGVQTFGYRIHKAGSDRSLEQLWASFAAVCPRCSKPIAFILGPAGSVASGSNFDAECGHFSNHNASLEDYELAILNVWPEPPKPSIPDHVPPAVERAMLQAERNYPMAGNEEAAGMMYRRTLELALKDKFPALTGSLASRIKKLVQDKTLPETMGDWADEIRDLGNDAAHDPGEVDRDQLRLIRGFTDATLRYLYTLPAEIEARRKLS